AALPAVRGNDSQACNALLAGVLRAHSNYVNALVANADGSLFCAAVPLPASRLKSATTFRWFQRAVATRATALGDPLISATTGQLAINVAHPLLDSTGQIARVAVVTIELEQLSRTAKQVALPHGATLTLFDRSRTIVARIPSVGSWLGKQVPDS